MYDNFKEFVNSQETQFASLINYFQDRLALEQQYAKELDRLQKKYTLVFDPDSVRWYQEVMQLCDSADDGVSISLFG
jgi:hypothetical protein